MFMTEVLRRCSMLEERVAAIYSQFAGSLNDEKEAESFFLGLAEEEKHHAKILAAEKAALDVDSDTGYFMPEFPAKLMEMDAMLKQVEEKARTGVTKEEAFALALELEQSELNTIYRDLVLMGRAAVKLMARHMDDSLSCPNIRRDWSKGCGVSSRTAQRVSKRSSGRVNTIWVRRPGGKISASPGRKSPGSSEDARPTELRSRVHSAVSSRADIDALTFTVDDPCLNQALKN